MTIGAGINGIAPAPIYTPRGPLTDALGNILYENQRVEFNETGLREVSKIADGKFFRATDTESLEQIYTDIDKLEKSTVSVKKYQQYRDLFPICLMSGCGLLVAQLLCPDRVEKITVEENVQPPTPNVNIQLSERLYNWQSHDLRRTRMALGMLLIPL